MPASWWQCTVERLATSPGLLKAQADKLKENELSAGRAHNTQLEAGRMFYLECLLSLLTLFRP